MDNVTSFISQHMEKRVTVYTVNGIRLYGVLTAYDGETITLLCNGRGQLVRWAAISTIAPYGYQERDLPFPEGR